MKLIKRIISISRSVTILIVLFTPSASWSAPSCTPGEDPVGADCECTPGKYTNYTVGSLCTGSCYQSSMLPGSGVGAHQLNIRSNRSISFLLRVKNVDIVHPTTTLDISVSNAGAGVGCSVTSISVATCDEKTLALNCWNATGSDEIATFSTNDNDAVLVTFIDSDRATCEAEVCDGYDNDCDGSTDEGLSCPPSSTPGNCTNPISATATATGTGQDGCRRKQIERYSSSWSDSNSYSPGNTPVVRGNLQELRAVFCEDLFASQLIPGCADPRNPACWKCLPFYNTNPWSGSLWSSAVCYECMSIKQVGCDRPYACYSNLTSVLSEGAGLFWGTYGPNASDWPTISAPGPYTAPQYNSGSGGYTYCGPSTNSVHPDVQESCTVKY